MNKNSIRVSVAGASGYTGGELLRYLLGHPQAEIRSVLANSQAGGRLTTLFPNLKGFLDFTLETADWKRLAQDNDLVFLCLPHGTSQEPVSVLREHGCKVVDLGADFRLQSPDLYQTTYGAEHLFPELLEQAAYGLPELNRDKIKNANLVANPGCYPTASTLALLPILSKGPLAQPPIIDAKSGVSGAGRGAKVDSLYCEVNENFRAYAVGAHRHQPEIEQNVGQPVMFTPHLVPMTRGILATVYVGLPTDGLLEHYQEFYSREPFVEVLTDSLPSTKSVGGTNFCKLAVKAAGHPDYTIVISAIDNLGKGAAGTAVHNMNLMFGLPETTGLQAPGLFP